MRLYVAALTLLFVFGLCGHPVHGQNSSPVTFAVYPEAAASYLQRLHGKSVQASIPSFAFRPDYPGGFRAWQHEARHELIKLLGLEEIRTAASSHSPKVQLGEIIDEGGYTRQSGEIETEPGVSIPFWLLQPAEKSKRLKPLVVCVHGHDFDGWNTYAGVYRDAKHQSETLVKDGNPGVQAVQRGYVALVPATRGLAAKTQIPDLKGRHGNRPCRAQLMHCLLAGRTAVGERVWDTQRILDWALSNIDGVDASQVALLGNSGGGVLAVYVAAIDERIAVAVPSCSFSSYTSSTGYLFHCDCCMVPSAQSKLGDMADIGSLMAPRRLLAVHGRKDGLHHQPDVDAAMRRVKSIYSAADASNAFRQQWGDSGHKFYPDIMWPFIDRTFDH